MNPHVSLAKLAVENYIKEKKVIKPPEDLPKDFLTKKSGVFITIEKQGQLRGCIGTYLPTKENIAKEVIQNAIAAAAEDYRFGPLQKEELPELSYTVYIINTPELIKNMTDLNPKKYGIIVKTLPISFPRPIGPASTRSRGERGSPEGAAGTDVMFNGHTPPKSGLLLPDLNGIETIEEQVSLACQKGKINPQTENIIVYKFTVEKFSEQDD